MLVSCGTLLLLYINQCLFVCLFIYLHVCLKIRQYVCIGIDKFVSVGGGKEHWVVLENGRSTAHKPFALVKSKYITNFALLKKLIYFTLKYFS